MEEVDKFREAEFKLQQEKLKWEKECEKCCNFGKCVPNCLILRAIDSINFKLNRLWKEGIIDD